VLSGFSCLKAPLRKLSSALPRLGPQVCVVGAGPAGFYVSQHLSKVIINLYTFFCSYIVFYS
jgi:NADPH-dependent glutamate synthase beta subunit-like oxidoreductase